MRVWKGVHYRPLLGRVMTGYSILRLRISAVLIMWGNYNYGVIYDKVKNTAAQSVW